MMITNSLSGFMNCLGCIFEASKQKKKYVHLWESSGVTILE